MFKQIRGQLAPNKGSLNSNPPEAKRKRNSSGEAYLYQGITPCEQYTFFDLPVELQLYIFSMLDPYHLHVAAEVSKHFHNLTNDPVTKFSSYLPKLPISYIVMKRTPSSEKINDEPVNVPLRELKWKDFAIEKNTHEVTWKLIELTCEIANGYALKADEYELLKLNSEIPIVSHFLAIDIINKLKSPLSWHGQLKTKHKKIINENQAKINEAHLYLQVAQNAGCVNTLFLSALLKRLEADFKFAAIEKTGVTFPSKTCHQDFEEVYQIFRLGYNTLYNRKQQHYLTQQLDTSIKSLPKDFLFFLTFFFSDYLVEPPYNTRNQTGSPYTLFSKLCTDQLNLLLKEFSLNNLLLMPLDTFGQYDSHQLINSSSVSTLNTYFHGSVAAAFSLLTAYNKLTVPYNDAALFSSLTRTFCRKVAETSIGLKFPEYYNTQEIKETLIVYSKLYKFGFCHEYLLDDFAKPFLSKRSRELIQLKEINKKLERIKNGFAKNLPFKKYRKHLSSIFNYIFEKGGVRERGFYKTLFEFDTDKPKVKKFRLKILSLFSLNYNRKFDGYNSAELPKHALQCLTIGVSNTSEEECGEILKLLKPFNKLFTRNPLPIHTDCLASLSQLLSEDGEIKLIDFLHLALKSAGTDWPRVLSAFFHYNVTANIFLQMIEFLQIFKLEEEPLRGSETGCTVGENNILRIEDFTKARAVFGNTILFLENIFSPQNIDCALELKETLEHKCLPLLDCLSHFGISLDELKSTLEIHNDSIEQLSDELVNYVIPNTTGEQQPNLTKIIEYCNSYSLRLAIYSLFNNRVLNQSNLDEERIGHSNMQPTIRGTYHYHAPPSEYSRILRMRYLATLFTPVPADDPNNVSPNTFEHMAIDTNPGNGTEEMDSEEDESITALNGSENFNFFMSL